MNNLTFDCTSDLDVTTTPTCATDYGVRVKKILFARDGDEITVAGTDGPTKAEIDTATAADDIVVLSGITNGKREFVSWAAEFSGDDTESGGAEARDAIMGITGFVKKVDETVLAALETLNHFTTVRCWFVTEKNYCFGGTDGYLVSPIFQPLELGGFGTEPQVPFRCEYFHDGRDTAKYDADYEDLTN